MLAHSLPRPGPATSASPSIRPRVTSSRIEWEWSLMETIDSLVIWIGEQCGLAVEQVMAELDGLFIPMRG